MSQNHIEISRGARLGSGITTLCFIQIPNLPLQEQIDIGRLPPGNYTISLTGSPFGTSIPAAQFANVPFTVSDARGNQVAPYVRLDYSGGWYDPQDPGWGLFISHDKSDNFVASWFTYTATGKAEWYTFQPTVPRWATGFQTIVDNFYLLKREPGSSSPPPTRTSGIAAGVASLNFAPLQSDGRDGYGYTFNSAVFTYTFTGGTTQVRTIQRFLQ